MTFKFDDIDEIEDVDDPPLNYEYAPKTYTSPLKLPEAVYSNDIVEQWMAFISDCHIPVELTLFEGNEDIKGVFSDKPFVIYPLLLIESKFLGFEGYIELESLGYEIQTNGGYWKDGFYVAKTSTLIKDLVVFCHVGKTKLDSTNIIDEKLKLLVATIQCEYHKKKGYLDSEERPLVKPEELVGLFEKDPVDKAMDCFNGLPKNIFENSNVLVELDDMFLYVNSGECAEPFKVDPTLLQSQSKNGPLIIYVLTKELTEKLKEERLQREWLADMPNRLDAKPILIFQVENKVIRGHQIFRAGDINKEGDYRGLLRFLGGYEFDQKDIFGRIVLKKQKNGNRIDLC